MSHSGSPSQSKIGDYKVLKVLGSGSFGQVNVGENEKTGEKVALKVISTATWNEKNRQRRTTLLKREIRLCRLLHHPNIIRLIGTMQEGENIVLVLEYQSGGTLESFSHSQKHGYISEKKCRDFFRQIISGVDYLHKNYMTHRDIKPANIILDKAHTTPKLIDFGFTNIFDEKEKMQSFLGSPHFAAPELLTATRYKGPAVDIWSLGVTLFASLTGRLPFQATTMEQLMDLIVCAQYTFPPHVSESAQKLIQRMLTVNMDERASMDEVRNHPWMNEGYGHPPPDLSIPRDMPITDIDEHLFKSMMNFGFDDPDEIRQHLESPENSTIKSVYCLLIEARAREQQQRYIDEAKSHAAAAVQSGGQSPTPEHDKAKRQSSAALIIPNAVKELFSPITKRRSSFRRKTSAAAVEEENAQHQGEEDRQRQAQQEEQPAAES